MFAVPGAARRPRWSDDLKLYQPAHGRFYLVAAHLCCRRFGFPDRGLSEAESVGFVLRRVEPTGSGGGRRRRPGTFAELAWVPAGGGGAWQAGRQPRSPSPTARRCCRWCRPCTPRRTPLAAARRAGPGRRAGALRGARPGGRRTDHDHRRGDLLANPHRALLEGTVIDAFRQVEELRGEAQAVDRRPGRDGALGAARPGRLHRRRWPAQTSRRWPTPSSAADRR